jgi:hypothetical protein
LLWNGVRQLRPTYTPFRLMFWELL